MMNQSISVESLRQLPAKQALIYLLQEKKRRTETDFLDQFFPDTGPLRRELYPKHIAMFAAGKQHDQRGCLGGNRIGKTKSIGGYETALHATGLYPHWWPGYVYPKKNLLIWACGTKSTKTRDVNQIDLIGKLVRENSTNRATGGLIPEYRIGKPNRKSGIQDGVDWVDIKHINGTTTTLSFKSYEEGRTAFQAEAVDFIWLDEECSKDIYDECMQRLLTTNGLMISTLTPMEGMTECTMALLKDTGLI